MLVANQAILYSNTPQIASMIHMAYFIAISARINGLGMEDCVSYTRMRSLQFTLATGSLAITSMFRNTAPSNNTKISTNGSACNPSKIEAGHQDLVEVNLY